MDSKLASLKVPELKALLTAAGLSVSGNKPDLIQRLLENPDATASLGGGQAASEPASTSAPAPAPAAPAPAPAAPVPAATATPTPAAVPVENNTAASAPAPAPAATINAGSAPAAAPDTTPAAAGPSEEERRQALIVELEKRKARAAKFGQPLGEAERKLERAIKFGLDAGDEADVAKLAQPLGARPPKKNGSEKTNTPKTDTPKAAKPVESEEQKQARLAHLEAEKEKARKRAERFGLVPKGESAEDADKKRKREARFNGGDEKKVKT